MCAAAEIHRQAAFGYPNIAICRGGVPASPNKSGNRIGGDGDGPLPGPVTLKLMRAFIDLAGMDFVAQALEMLSANEAADSLAEWRARLAD